MGIIHSKSKKSHINGRKVFFFFAQIQFVTGVSVLGPSRCGPAICFFKANGAFGHLHPGAGSVRPKKISPQKTKIRRRKKIKKSEKK